VTALMIGLAIFSAALFGGTLGAWAALDWVRRLRPGRESDLLVELAALRASQGLHLSALKTQADLLQAARNASPETPA